MLISIISPAYNEAQNLPALHERLRAVMATAAWQWEWIIVDDHSADDTFAVIRQLADADARVKGLRLARNAGSHAAIVCGVEHAAGECCIALASDLQDPPELIPALVAQWRAGYEIVWATRNQSGDNELGFFSRWYYALMRSMAGMREMPAQGADFFLLDRKVADALTRFGERNMNVFALLLWMGFRQTSVPYEKQKRLRGRSGWSLGKKVKLLVDSVASFSYAPIRLLTLIGFSVALVGFLYALFLIGNAILGKPPEGWSSLMIVVLVLGGMQMLMMGVLGEYLWRALDEIRRRPRYLVQDATANVKMTRRSNAPTFPE
ncbi:MAG: glycosyl transferase [Chloroflexota bacterium]|nr:MAG: glycosyl transferase [Chloroflexota bacterium]